MPQTSLVKKIKVRENIAADGISYITATVIMDDGSQLECCGADCYEQDETVYEKGDPNYG